MRCENCSKNHTGVYGSGRFCSERCARGFATKAKRKEINLKVSETLTGYLSPEREHLRVHPLECPECGAIYKPLQNNRKYCSTKCAIKAVHRDPSYRNNLSKINLQKVKDGTHKGWQSRKKRSYAEQFFEDVLKNNNLWDKCSPEHPVKKRDLEMDCDANYFLDFYFPDKKIDLEIDGKQHEYEDRKASDQVRDLVLTKKGYTVYRIKWKNINTQEGKEYISNEINKFLDFYHSQY